MKEKRMNIRRVGEEADSVGQCIMTLKDIYLVAETRSELGEMVLESLKLYNKDVIVGALTTALSNAMGFDMLNEEDPDGEYGEDEVASESEDDTPKFYA